MFLVVEVAQFRERVDKAVPAEVVEGSRGHSPLLALAHALLFPLLLSFQVGALRTFGVGDFVEAGKDVTTGNVLERGSSLDEEATRWEIQGDFLLISGPQAQSRVARLPMNSHKTDVVVVSGENSSNIVLLEIRSRWGQ